MTPLKQRGKIRRTNIYTIRLKSMTPLKQMGKVKWTNIYTKGRSDGQIYSP